MFVKGPYNREYDSDYVNLETTRVETETSKLFPLKVPEIDNTSIKDPVPFTTNFNVNRTF